MVEVTYELFTGITVTVCLVQLEGWRVTGALGSLVRIPGGMVCVRRGGLQERGDTPPAAGAG